MSIKFKEIGLYACQECNSVRIGPMISNLQPVLLQCSSLNCRAAMLKPHVAVCIDSDFKQFVIPVKE